MPEELPKKPVVGIMGTHIFPGKHANLGVSALCESLIRLCLENEDCEIWLFDCHSSNEKSVTLRPTGSDFEAKLISWRLALGSKWKSNLALIAVASLIYRLLPFSIVRNSLSRTFPWIAALEQVSFVGDIHGGDSFSDIYGMGRFTRAWIAACTVLLVGKVLVQFPQTYGPFKSPIARYMAQFLIRRSALVVARDKASQDVAQKLLGRKGSVVLSPDVAFVLNVEAPKHLEISPTPPSAYPEGSDLIGINVNGLMFNGGYTRNNMFGLKMDYRTFLRELVVELLNHHKGEILLVPHTITPPGISESDNEANEWLWNSLSEHHKIRVRRVEGVYNCHEIKSAIGNCSFFIGSRMHSCIAALSQGIPCVGVAYSMKFKGVFESVGMSDWVLDAREFDEHAAIAEIVKLFQIRGAVSDRLKTQVSEAKGVLSSVFKMIFNLKDRK